jgi:hypothetical protein
VSGDVVEAVPDVVKYGFLAACEGGSPVACGPVKVVGVRTETDEVGAAVLGDVADGDGLVVRVPACSDPRARGERAVTLSEVQPENAVPVTGDQVARRAAGDVPEGTQLVVRVSAAEV